MTLSIELPFFPGFYETPLYDSDLEYGLIRDELDYYNSEGQSEVTEDDLEFDYDSYIKSCCKCFVEEFEFQAPSNIVEKIDNYDIDSPREYNFSNDRLFADVTFKDGWENVMRKFMADNADWLKERIKKEWSSRDGFVSFMCNDFTRWDEYLFVENDTRYISSMLEYMMLVENKHIYETLIQGTLEGVWSDDNYVHLVEEPALAE